MNIAKLVVALVLVTAARPGAEEINSVVTLHLQGVGPGNSTDYVNGTCKREANIMKCHFTSTFILPPKSEDEIRSKIDKQLPSWMQDVREKTHEQLCSYLSITNDSRFLSEPDPRTTNPADVARVKQMLEHQNETTKAMCDNPSEENVKRMMRARIEVENAICKVHSSVYDEEFTMQHDNVWVSNSGKPDFLCGAIHIGTLRQNSTGNAEDWTYDVKTINTRPEGPFCGGKAEYSEQFAWTINTGARACKWVVVY